MKILAITIGSPDVASTRFRLMQYRSLFARYGATFEFVEHTKCDGSIFEKAREADLVINQKCLLRRSFARKLAAASRRLIFDFDDAIYTRPGRPYGWFTRLRVESRFRYWVGAADLVIAANGHLAEAAQKHAKRVERIPMVLDIDLWKPLETRDSGGFRIGWVGAPVNLAYLEGLDGLLCEALKRLPQARLAVFSGKKPNLSCPFDYVPFTPGGEVDFIRNLDVGLLPLPDEEYARGKSPIKAIQYLSCGVPVVGNVWGATKEICNLANSIRITGTDEWVGALERLASDPQGRVAMGQAGRQHIEKHHDARVVGERFWQVCADLE